MADDPLPPPHAPETPAGALPASLKIWLQFGGLLIGIYLFGWLVFRLTRIAHLGL